LLAVLILGNIGVQIVNPQIVRRFIDATQSETGSATLLYAALAFIGLALLQQILAVGATYVGENVAWAATNALRAALVRHCLRLDMGFHNDTPPAAESGTQRIHDQDQASLVGFHNPDPAGHAAGIHRPG
ncbi:MAG: ABC transporter transmembrane domain-containing protein, partial [Anaerolineae bacterium]|nr:ABC transporter transmembrane domain-containing protein [Anaerolineae bacterium]